MKRTITHSELASWGICGMLHHLRYMAGPNGCGVVSTLPYMPWIEGRLLHHTLEIWRRTGQMQKVNFIKWSKKMMDGLTISPDVQPAIDRRIHACYGACLAYKDFYSTDKARNWLGLEQEFQFETAQYVFRGVIDAYFEEQKDIIILQETKFISAAFASKILAIPINLQRLMYIFGIKQLTGLYPSYVLFDFIYKTQLRLRKGEQLPAYETRIHKAYLADETKFYRDKQPVETRLIETAKRVLLDRRVNLMLSSAPDMREESCMKFGSPCVFLPACIAHLEGRGEGWDAPQCAGLYRPKERRHPELSEE